MGTLQVLENERPSVRIVRFPGLANAQPLHRVCIDLGGLFGAR